MTTRPLTKIVTLAVPAGLLLSFGGGGAGRALALVAGAVLVGLAWARLERRAAATPSAPTIATARDQRWRTEEQRRSQPQQKRIDRSPTGRAPRDLRCPASTRVTARARRSR